MSDAVARLNAALEGRYAIERELGEGGMATVYLADDLKHQRKVALKVLKPELAAVVGAERFLAEIQVTANLQHPNILPLFDSGEADSFLFYVMPYVEGDTLKDRLAHEGQLPVNDAVAITKDVAEALQAAHEQGVIHRDIKPGNVLISRGKPLISDFGIALALSASGAGERLTETGLSLGTPYYMSPEQATGDQAVGASTDTYALGCVLYEMLVGEPPYAGSTAQAVLGKIVAGKHISATEERPSVPANVDGAIRKALEKLAADRFTSVQDFAKALGDEHFRYGELAEAGAGAASGPWNRLTLAFAGALAVTLVLFTSSLLDRPTPEVVRFSVPLGLDADVYLGGGGRPSRTALAFSPDGDRLVYSATVPGEGSRLYLQRMDQERAEPLVGTEGARLPFFSPDGAWIGFWAEGSLRRVSVADGRIETIVQTWLPRGATWGDDGTIVWSGAGGLYHVAETGGEVEMLAAQDTLRGAWTFRDNDDDLIRENRREGGLVYAQPHMLPGSEALLLHAMGSFDPQRAEIRALDLASGTLKTVLMDAMDPRYVPTGHLLFVRQGTLMAIGFDLERVEVRGQPVTVLEDVMHSIFMTDTRAETGAAQVAVSAPGHLAYAAGGVTPYGVRTAVRVTSDGNTLALDMDRRVYGHFRASPDGNRLAFSTRGEGGQIWVHDLIRGTTQLLNTGGFSNAWMEWSPDGRSLAFSSDRDGDVINIYSLAVDGSGEPERLASSNQSQFVASWSSEGVIAFLEGGDIWILPPDGSPAPFFTSEANDLDATFSSDGRWLAYRSTPDVSTGSVPGQEVYVRPYPGPGPATLISTDGGINPTWSPDDRQIFYLQPPGVLMAVDVTPGDEFQAGRPTSLIDRFSGSMSPVRSYDIFPDGSFVTRTLVGSPPVDPERLRATELHVILNWTEELKERVPN